MLNTLSFRTAGMAAVWLCEVRGQFSDGYYENKLDMVLQYSGHNR